MVSKYWSGFGVFSPDLEKIKQLLKIKEKFSPTGSREDRSWRERHLSDDVFIILIYEASGFSLL